MSKEIQKQFTSLQKLLLTLGVLFPVVFIFFYFFASGDMTINRTLTSMPILDSGLVNHWTFDASYNSLYESSSNTSTATTSVTGGGAISTGTCVNGGWNDANNITASDNAYATATLSSAEPGIYVTGSALGFSIPSDATIVGITAGFERKDSGSSPNVEDSQVRLRRSTFVLGTQNKAKMGVDWPNADAYSYYGGITDLWGEAWTPSSINSSGFGLAICGIGDGANTTAYIDHIQMKVYYLTMGNILQSQSRGTSATAATSSTVTSMSPGRLGQGISFDGTDDYARAGNAGSGIKTIAFWMYADDNTSRKILNIDGTDQIELNGSGQVTATSFPGTTVIYVDASTASSAVEQGRWHHVVITDTTGVTASTFEIGRVTTSYFDGMLDDIRLYSRVLSPEDVRRLYQLGGTSNIQTTVTTPAGLSAESSLVGHWTFDGKSITRAANSSASTGNTNPTSGANRTGAGSVAWTSATNIYASDDARATASLGAFAGSNYLQAKTFNFAIPTNAQIVGVELGIERYASGGSVTDTDVNLVDENNAIVGTDKASGSAWPTTSGTEAYATYGGSADLWSLTLTPAIINDADFGAILRVSNGSISSRTANVDHMRINVYYTLDGAYLVQSRTSANIASTTTATLAVGAIGQGIEVDGVDDTVRTSSTGLSSIGTNNQPYTIAAWVKVAPGETAGNIVHMSSTDAGTGWCLPPLAVTGSAFRAFSYNSGGVTATAPTSYETNRWYHVATTWDASNGLRLWVDGSVVATTAQANYTASGASNYLHFGSSPAACTGDTGFFNGSIDDVRVYSKSLSSEEMRRIYQLGGTASVNTTVRTSDTLRSGLVLHYTFDGKNIDLSQTSAEVRDVSASALHGDGVNLSIVPGVIGQALDLDSTTDEVNSASTAVLNTDSHSIVFWIRFNTISDSYYQVFAHRPAGTDRSPSIWTNPAGNCFHWKYDSGNSGTNCFGPTGESTYFPVGEWYHVVGTKNGGTFTMYINGVQIGSTIAVTNPKASGSAAIELGGTGYSSAIVSLDDLRIYNRVISAEDVKRLYRLGR